MAVSIRDVANKAGVSLATVSKVLNDRTGTRIALATQTKVRETAASLGYQPNRFARSIAVRKTNTLALLISGLQNPFFLNILEESERRLMSVGYQVIVDAAPSISGTYVTHGKLSGWPVDGVLMWASVDQSIADMLGSQAEALPVVYLGYGRTDGSSWVAFDLVRGGEIAADYLLGRGHRRIGYVHPWDTSDMARFPTYSGFAATCARAGVDVTLINTINREETQRAGLETGLSIAAMPDSIRPKAILCHNDVIAIGVYHGLVRAGLKVPEDIALVGFDGVEEGQCLDKPLTTIRTPTPEFCQLAIDILLEKLTGGQSYSVRNAIVSPTLMIGETA